MRALVSVALCGVCVVVVSVLSGFSFRGFPSLAGLWLEWLSRRGRIAGATPNMFTGSSSASMSEGQREHVTSYEEVEVAVLGDPAHTARLTALLTTAEPTRSAALGIERT